MSNNRSNNMGKKEQVSYWEGAYPGGAALAKRFEATLGKPAYGAAVVDTSGVPIPGYESVTWGGDYGRYLPSNIMAIYTPLALSEAVANGFVWTGDPQAKDGTRLKAARMAGKVSAAYPDLAQANFRAALSRVPLTVNNGDGSTRTFVGITVGQLIQFLDGMRDIAVNSARRTEIGIAGQKAIAFTLNLAKFANTPEIRAIADQNSRRFGTQAYMAEEGLAVAFGGAE